MLTYLPRRKPKKFCPNPVAKFGIPDYANSRMHPEVENTSAWKEWWNEQIDYMINGYYTAGISVPGRLYKFLNFDIISGVGKGNHYPEPYDLAFEVAETIEEAKRTGQGVIGLKARRKGFSFDAICMEIDYGFRFIDGYQAGVCAGSEVHVSDFYNKFINQFFLKEPELKMRLLSKGSKDSSAIAGYRVKTNTGWEEQGSKHTLHFETMYSNPNKFKGKYLHAQIFEESGEFPMLEKCFNASKDCWMEGNMMVGTPYVYGTGGNIKSSSKDFKMMWYNAEAYRLIKIFAPATRMYFPAVSGYSDRYGNLMEDVPNLKRMYDPHERVGMEDVERAKQMILEDRAEKRKSEDKSLLHDHYQNNPLDEKEAFLQFSANNFDSELLNDQLWEIDNNRRRYGKFRLEFMKNEKGELLTPLKVKAIPDKKNGNWMIHANGHPRPRYRNLDIAGLDSYDMDQSMTSASLGSMVVLRRKNEIKDMLSRVPIGLLYYRPRKKEIFYEETLKGAIYWNLVMNVLVDAGSPLIIDYWKQYGGLKYLAIRPKKFDSPNSQQVHDIGVKLTVYSKPMMMGLIQTWVLDYAKDCWFPQILQDVLDYDESRNDSDWDSADALGIALMRDTDMSSRITDENTLAKENPYEFPEWTEDSEGNIIPKASYADVSDIEDPFLKMLHSGQLGN